MPASLPSRLSELYTHIKRDLWAGGISTADLDARIIIRSNTGFDWADIITSADTAIDKSLLEKISNDMQRRIAGEPVSRIYGQRQFWGLDFNICTDTLDPRPDSETLIEAVLNRFADKPPEMILDLGTGSGCLLLALLSEFKTARGYGVDKSLGALKTAKQNAEQLGLVERAHFYCGSWGQSLSRNFDLIVSNPPYIPNQVIPSLSKEVRNHDPILALDGGDDGLEAYRCILTEIPAHLSEGGFIFFEVGYNQGGDVSRLVEDAGFSVEAIHDDLAGKPRVVEISSGDK